MPDGIAKFDWRAFTPDDSPKTPMDLIADPQFRKLVVPDLAKGDRAFDFELPLHDFATGVARETGEVFGLLRAAESQPVALIFGSYT